MDLIIPSKVDLFIGEAFFLKYEPHITDEMLDEAWLEYQSINKKTITPYTYIASSLLTRQEKIILLENKFKIILREMKFEARNQVVRKTIRIILQEKPFYHSVY